MSGEKNPFRQRLPFFALLSYGIAGILMAHWTSWPSQAWVGFVLITAAGYFFTRRTLVFAMLIATVFGLIHIWQSRESAGAEFHRLIPDLAVVEVTGIVDAEPRVFATRSSFPLQVTALRWQGQTYHPPIKLLADWPGEPPTYGDEVRASGVIEGLAKPRNPGQFNFARWAQWQGIYNRLKIGREAEARILGHNQGNPIVALAHRCGSWVRTTLTEGVDDPLISNLLVGMILGDVSEMPDHVQEQFRGTGTFHLFSVSGLHVSIIAVIFWSLARVLPIPRRAAVVVTISLVFFYVLITGWKPASVRSAIMAAIVLCGLLAERPPILMNNLLAAGFFILLANTNDLFHAGFQFSFCVVLAILCLAAPLTSWLEKPFQRDPFLPEKLVSVPQRILIRGGSRFASLAAVSIAAWCGSLPLTVGYFNLVSLTSLPANMIAVPVSFGIMAVGMLSLTGGILSTTVAIIFNQTNWLLTKILLGAVSFFAALPGSYFYVRLPEVSYPQVEITVFDFGTGGSVFVRSGEKSWLIDSGPAHTYNSVLLPFLRSQGLRKVDGFFITHGDAGHVGAGSDLLISCPPGLVVDSVLSDRSSTRNKLRQTILETGIPFEQSQAGWKMRLSPSCELEVLYPTEKVEMSIADDKAIVLLIHAGKTRILLMSDGGPPTERWLLENSSDKISADILIKNASIHRPSSESDFLSAVSPKVVISGAEEYQDLGITERFSTELAASGIRHFRQGDVGAVTIRIYPERCEISSFLNNEPFVFP